MHMHELWYYLHIHHFLLWNMSLTADSMEKSTCYISIGIEMSSYNVQLFYFWTRKHIQAESPFNFWTKSKVGPSIVHLSNGRRKQLFKVLFWYLSIIFIRNYVDISWNTNSVYCIILSVMILLLFFSLTVFLILIFAFYKLGSSCVRFLRALFILYTKIVTQRTRHSLSEHFISN